MLKRTIIAVAALSLAGGVFGQAYRWVDEEGIVHYSDRPEPGAELIELPQQRSSRPTSRPAPSPSRSTRLGATQQQAEAPDTPFSYETITVTSPAAEETLWNIEGVLSVTVSLQPSLQPGHRVRAYFDGNQQNVNGTNFQIAEVYRGVHNIQVEILDENGRLMIRSTPNRFYVQQNSIAMNR